VIAQLEDGDYEGNSLSMLLKIGNCAREDAVGKVDA